LVRVWPNPALRPWRARTVQTLKAHDGGVTAVAHGTPRMLATAGADGRVTVWTLRPAPVARLLALGLGMVRTLRFSRDGRRLLAGGEDGLIHVWTLPAPPVMGAS
jgi:WD40 repeat protein